MIMTWKTNGPVGSFSPEMALPVEARLSPACLFLLNYVSTEGVAGHCVV